MASWSRIRALLAREGVTGMAGKITRKIWREKLHFRQAVFVADPCHVNSPVLPENITLVCRPTPESVAAEETEQFERLKGVETSRKQASKRFADGAKLWMFKDGASIICFLWSMRGGGPEGYLPFLTDDDYLFDGGAFPHQRGKGIFGLFLTAVAAALRQEGVARVYFAVATWNEAMLRCATKTPFREIGRCLYLSFANLDFCLWNGLKKQATR